MKTWFKPTDNPSIIAIKEVDWSILNDGSHIPEIFHEDFEHANNGQHIALGSSKDISLDIDGEVYNAFLYNIDRKDYDKDTLQIRYNKVLKELMRDTFNSSYRYLKQKREDSESNKQYRVPNNKKEYIEFYQTSEPFKYQLKLITVNNSLAEPISSIFKTREEAETAYGLIRQTCNELEIKQPSNQKFSITLRNNNMINFNFCDWQILGFKNEKFSKIKMRMALLKKYSTDDMVLIYDFVQDDNEPKVCLYEFEVDSIKEYQEIIRSQYLETLRIVIKERFKSYNKSKYKQSNNDILSSTIFNVKLQHYIFVHGINDENKSIEDARITDMIEEVKNYISSKGFTYPRGLIENFYLSLKTKPFVLLAGVSGTGKTKLVKLFAEAIGCTEENAQFKMISVRPDWSDSSDLLGYKDIQGKFQAGPMIDVLQNAIANPDNIYFVCLDEMNLARVEYYFSDFLSIMETRRKDEEGRILTSYLLNDDVFANPDDKEKYNQLIIPDNLYIVGTVNMDETTHPFSKKVLDRANTIEFSEIDLLSYRLSNDKDDIQKDMGRISNEFLKADYLTLNDCSAADEEIIKEIVENIQKVNDILEEANLQVGYRVRDEFCFYMIYNEHENLIDRDKAFDFQLVQKILPRIQGSSRTIKNVLIKLYNFTTGENLSVQEGELGDTAIKLIEDFKDGKNNIRIKYPMSAEKIATMIKRIEEDGFTAYWL